MHLIQTHTSIVPRTIFDHTSLMENIGDLTNDFLSILLNTSLSLVIILLAFLGFAFVMKQIKEDNASKTVQTSCFNKLNLINSLDIHQPRKNSDLYLTKLETVDA